MGKCKQIVTEDCGITSQKRDERIDSLKGGLIILVIVGHLLELNIDSFGCNYAHNFIYLFHIPLFVFISGYVSNVNSKRFFVSTFSLLEIYFIYQVLYSLQSLPAITINISRPYLHLWYLPSLFIWRIIDYYTQIYKTKYIVLLSLTCAILCGFVEQISYEFTLSRLIVFSFYYFLGRLCREKNVVNKLFELPHRLGYCFIVITLFALLFVTNLGRVVYCSQPYTILSSNIITGCLIRISYMIYSTLLCASIINCYKVSLFANTVGKKSLPIYVYHAVLILITILLRKLIDFPVNFVTSIISAITFAYAMIFLSKFIRFSIFLHPISYHIGKKLHLLV